MADMLLITEFMREFRYNLDFFRYLWYINAVESCFKKQSVPDKQLLIARPAALKNILLKMHKWTTRIRNTDNEKAIR